MGGADYPRDPATGQRKRRSFCGPTAASVRAKLKKDARKRVDDGAPMVDAKQSVASWRRTGVPRRLGSIHPGTAAAGL